MSYTQVLLNPILHNNFKTSLDNIWTATRISSTVCLLVLTCDTNGFNSCFRILRDVGKGGGKEVRARKGIHRFLGVVGAIKVSLKLNEHHHLLQHASALFCKTLNFFTRVRGFYLLHRFLIRIFQYCKRD